MEDVMKNLSTYISCFEFDKFEPIATEYEMEEKGTNDIIVIDGLILRLKRVKFLIDIFPIIFLSIS